MCLCGHGGTHVEALAHVRHDDMLCTGFPADGVRSPGAKRPGIGKPGSLVGRGVLPDLRAHRGVARLEAGEVLTPAELTACAEVQRTPLAEGDILLVCTGWQPMVRDTGICLMERLDLAALAASGHRAFLVVAASLTVTGGVGSPITPPGHRMSGIATLSDKARITGIGQTDHARSGGIERPEFRPCPEAVMAAADDAGIPVAETGGFASFGRERPEPVMLQAAPGAPGPRFSGIVRRRGDERRIRRQRRDLPQLGRLTFAGTGPVRSVWPVSPARPGRGFRGFTGGCPRAAPAGCCRRYVCTGRSW